MKKIIKNIVIGSFISSIIMVMFIGCGQETVNSTKDENEKIEKVVVVTSGEGIPYSLLDDKQKWTGIDAEMWEEIGKRAGWEIEVRQGSFDSIFGELDAKRADVAANCFAIKKERTDKYYASVPYYGDAQSVAVKENNDNINTLDDLKGKKVGVCSGQASQTILEEMAKNDNFDLSLYDMTSTGLTDLNLGRLDAVGGATTTINEYTKSTGTKLKILDEKLAANNVGYFFTKTERGAIIKEQVDKILEEMLKDGTCSRITKKWLDDDMTAYITE